MDEAQPLGVTRWNGTGVITWKQLGFAGDSVVAHTAILTPQRFSSQGRAPDLLSRPSYSSGSASGGSRRGFRGEETRLCRPRPAGWRGGHPSRISSVLAAPTATFLHLTLPERVGSDHLFSARALPKGVLEPIDLEVAASGTSFSSACDMNDQGVQRRKRPFGAAIVELPHEGSDQLAFTPLVQLLRRRQARNLENSRIANGLTSILCSVVNGEVDRVIDVFRCEVPGGRHVDIRPPSGLAVKRQRGGRTGPLWALSTLPRAFRRRRRMR